MTDDVPRRSYPMVVSPPGGFEDAVRRGRRIRRRRTGGSTGAALVLVGALAYSVVSTTDGTNSLDPAKQPKVDHSQPTRLPGSLGSPDPITSPSTTVSSAAGTNTGTGSRPGSGPTSVPTSLPTKPPTREPGSTATLPYAVRPAIKFTQEYNSPERCLPPDQSASGWCTYATGQTDPDDEDRSLLRYRVCRALNAGPGTLDLTRTPQVNFAAKDVANNDTVWTWSVGQPVTQAASQVDVTAGYCVDWYTSWDGFDDWGRLPPAGTYEVTAHLHGTPPLTTTGEFQHF